MRGKELAALVSCHSSTIKAEKSFAGKILILNAYIRQLLGKIRDTLKIRLAEEGKVVQVCSKIAAHAIQIIDYVKVTITNDPSRRKEISLDSQQARILFSGAGGEIVSRKETIRAMKRVTALWPAFNCDHRPGDGRQTMRLIAKVNELQDAPLFGYRDLWQRSDRSVSLVL